MKVSVVVPVLNEEESLPELLRSLEEQTRAPDEAVVADDGSTDGTLALLRAYSGPLRLRVLEHGGRRISAARNAAIRAATGEIIAATDAGVRLAPRWLEALATPIEQGRARAVAGFFAPDPRTPFETALGATVFPDVSDIDPRTFLPAGRSMAFLKEVWELAGGYPEWLDYCEDLVFDLAVRRLGVEFLWAPEAIAYARPRPDLKSFFLQYYRYARGDGKAGLWPGRHLVRYAAYGSVLLALALGGASPAVPAVLLVAGAGYLRRPYQRLLPRLSGMGPGHRAFALAAVPVIRATGDAAKMLGYPVGVWWRLRGGRGRERGTGNREQGTGDEGGGTENGECGPGRTS